MESTNKESGKPDVGFAWRILDVVLRGTFKHHETGEILLPFVVLRRLDCMLEHSAADVRKQAEQLKTQGFDEETVDRMLKSAAVGSDGKRLNFYNRSAYDLVKLAQDPQNIKFNFSAYLHGFSENVQEIMRFFQLERALVRLERNGLLFKLIDEVSRLDLSVETHDNHDMGLLFEELIRISNEQSNETAGEHFTPRDVVKLMAAVLLEGEDERLKEPGAIHKIYDLCCGTGGMLTVAKQSILESHPSALVEIFGQEINEMAFAIAKSDLLITGEDPNNIRLGNTITNDRHPEQKFHYMLANPPYGVNWAKDKAEVALDLTGRYHDTPRTSDGQFLFLQHMISKMKHPSEGGGRIAVITNGSPLFTGDAGSGESNIRKWIIENDWLEALIALPGDLFFNTGISTYIWVLSNRKSSDRKGRVQLIDASDMGSSLKKSLNNKRKEISDEAREAILKLYGTTEDSNGVKWFPNEYFGYTKVMIEQPLKENGQVVTNRKGEPKSDSSLRDYERVPLTEDIETYFNREVQPHLPESWVEWDKNKVGYEVNFTKYFYTYKPLRSLQEITSDLMKLEEESQDLLSQIVE